MLARAVVPAYRTLISGSLARLSLWEMDPPAYTPEPIFAGQLAGRRSGTRSPETKQRMTQPVRITPISEAKRPLFLGVDVGGTGIKIGLVDDLGRMLAFESLATS